MAVRATTTTNARGRKQRFVLPPKNKSNELDIPYLRALKVIDQTRRQQDATPTITEKTPRRSDAIKQKNPKSFYQLSSTLTPIGQEAMLKTYEDTLVSHLTNVYSSKRIGNVLPRLHTAAFRHRLPIINNCNRNHTDNIHQAQNLIDNILNNNSQKDEILCDYVRWQQQWTKNFV
ncbi:unnamed protein product [Rotaria sordida]|uniref:Uncharacterized protein n=1 Tax=Rotaria sordida TaxID=392033 RepID=A0A814K2Z9_9BILA|nr:unnamed protein product [Rotaria sordida]CAF1201222.1 unnamed protein product [Rotaria sordida]